MSQNTVVLPTSGTVSGLAMTQNTNNALDTLNTLWSGAAAPASPESGQWWHDTTNNILKLRSMDNTQWIAIAMLSESAYIASPAYPGQVTGNLNRALNAGMMIDQVNEGASYSIPVNGTLVYTVDQWLTECVSGSASGVTAQRVSDAPAGLTNSLKVTVGNGAGSVAAGDYLVIYQPIEANNLSDFGYGGTSAIASSLCFWAKSSVSGVFAASLQNAANDRSIVSKFTLASAGTWQLITLPGIPGDVAGTWAGGNNAMLDLIITIASGTTYQNSTLGSWLAANSFASTFQSNSVLTTSGASFQLW